MTEIKKFTKILLLVEVIIWFIFGINLTFLYDMFMNPEGWTNPYFPRMFGGINFVSSIFAFIMLRENEWEEIKMTFAYFIGILSSTVIIEITIFSIFGSTFGAATVQLGSSTIILEAVLLILGILVYLKQRS